MRRPKARKKVGKKQKPPPLTDNQRRKAARAEWDERHGDEPNFWAPANTNTTPSSAPLISAAPTTTNPPSTPIKPTASALFTEAFSSCSSTGEVSPTPPLIYNDSPTDFVPKHNHYNLFSNTRSNPP